MSSRTTGAIDYSFKGIPNLGGPLLTILLSWGRIFSNDMINHYVAYLPNIVHMTNRMGAGHDFVADYHGEICRSFPPKHHG